MPSQPISLPSILILSPLLYLVLISKETVIMYTYCFVDNTPQYVASEIIHYLTQYIIKQNCRSGSKISKLNYPHMDQYLPKYESYFVIHHPKNWGWVTIQSCTHTRSVHALFWIADRRGGHLIFWQIWQVCKLDAKAIQINWLRTITHC